MVFRDTGVEDNDFNKKNKSNFQQALNNVPSFEEHIKDVQCEKIFERSADEMAREFQLLRLIDGYKKWGFNEENVEIHKEIMKAAANGDIDKRLDDTFYDDGSLKTMTMKLKDGRILTEERIYPRTQPELNLDKIDDYRDKGIITVNDSLDVDKAFSIMEGGVVDMDESQIRDFRERLGDVKNKVTNYYNDQYQEAISHNDEYAREGGAIFTEVEGNGGEKIPVTVFQGAKFGFLVHVRNAMRMTQGKTGEDVAYEIDPKQDWITPRKDGQIPHGLSTSYISNEKINLFYPGEIILGFTDIREHPIVTMGAEDLGSSINAHHRYSIIGTHGNEEFMEPEELIERTGNDYSYFNELALDRYSDDGAIIQPNCLIVFGKNEDEITALQKRYAESFGVPICMIDQEKYGGVNNFENI